jgi:Glyoxalase-like domain
MFKTGRRVVARLPGGTFTPAPVAPRVEGPGRRLPHDLELLMSAAVYAVTFDCGNAATLARFWSGVLERSIDPDASEEFASIGLQDAGAARPGLMFNKVPEGKAAKNRVHLDLVAATLETEVDRLLALGADRLGDFDEGGARWVTLADPEGNEFDVLAEQA